MKWLSSNKAEGQLRCLALIHPREERERERETSMGNTTLATGMAQTIGRLTPHDGECSMQVTAAREVTVFYSQFLQLLGNQGL